MDNTGSFLTWLEAVGSRPECLRYTFSVTRNYQVKSHLTFSLDWDQTLSSPMKAILWEIGHLLAQSGFSVESVTEEQGSLPGVVRLHVEASQITPTLRPSHSAKQLPLPLTGTLSKNGQGL